jgi:hypothetical protein
MKTYTYHREIKILLAQVLNALDHLIIKRYNELDETTVTDQVAVSLVYAPKQRVLYDLVNKSQHLKLPVMALTMSSINYDAKRAFNKIEGFTVSHIFKPEGANLPQPVPVEISLNLSIMARYQNDIDQILTCIFSNFFPYIILSYEHPDLNHEVRCKLEWNKNINLQYPLDITNNQPYRVLADAQFTLQGWIYRNSYNNSGIIYNIPTTFTAVSAIYDDYDTMHNMESDITTDSFVVSGRPFMHNSTPCIIHSDATNRTLNIKGNMFDYLSGICLSSLNGNVFSTSSYQTFNPFVNYKHLSSTYPAFTAVSAEFTKLDNNNISINIPYTQNIGYFDVIGYGIAGLGKLTQDSRLLSGVEVL